MQKSLHSAQYQHFLRELRDARSKANVTQEELAKRLGVHQTFVSKGETGLRRIDLIEVRDWVRALGIQFTDFSLALDKRILRNRPLSSDN